jgi:tmRNA-binding protein
VFLSGDISRIRRQALVRKRGRKVVAKYSKARHDYHILDVFEAGIVLSGTEVKMRLGFDFRHACTGLKEESMHLLSILAR